MPSYGKIMLGVGCNPYALKLDYSSLSWWERTMYQHLVEKLTPYLGRVSQQILSIGGYDLSNLEGELLAFVIEDLNDIYVDRAVQFSNSAGDAIPIKPNDIATAATQWAKEYGYTLIQGLVSTTEKIVQSAIAYSMGNEGATLGRVMEMLEPAFGRQRAMAIAVTETTRANAQAMRGLQEHYAASYQVLMTRVWQTNRDELVCPVCGPLHNKPEKYWSDRFPDGAPAHPYCRCGIVLRRASRYA